MQIGGQRVLKEILKSRIEDPDDYFNEARAITDVKHPHIAPINCASQNEKHVLITMPYFDKGSLYARLKKTNYSLRDTIKLGLGILNGLSHIHFKGYAHLDIKPSNILFSQNDKPLITDFGQSRRMLFSGVAIAPEMYELSIPPEVIQSKTVTKLTDIYQTSLTLYRVMNSEAYFNYQTPRTDVLSDKNKLNELIINGKFPQRESMPHVPSNLSRILQRGMDIDPANRYQSARDFAFDLGKVVIAQGCNWKVSHYSQSKTIWDAENENNKSNLHVEKTRNSDGRWDILTQRIGRRTTKRITECCSNSLTEKQADRKLKTIFRKLAAA